MFWIIFIFRKHSTRETASSRVTYFILRAYQELVLSTANTGKTCERFWKNAGEWTGRVEISKGETPGGKRSTHGNILTYSRF